MIYLQLYGTFMLIGLLTIGGGYSALPLLQEHCVSGHGWLTMTEFSDLVAIAEITPGPISINAATFVGVKVGGFLGGIIATLGFVTLPFLIVSILFIVYKKYRKMTIMQGVLGGLRPAIVALIASAGLSILILALFGEGGLASGDLELLPILLFTAALVVLRLKKPNPIFIILGSGAVGLIAHALFNQV